MVGDLAPHPPASVTHSNKQNTATPTTKAYPDNAISAAPGTATSHAGSRGTTVHSADDNTRTVSKRSMAGGQGPTRTAENGGCVHQVCDAKEPKQDPSVQTMERHHLMVEHTTRG